MILVELEIALARVVTVGPCARLMRPDRRATREGQVADLALFLYSSSVAKLMAAQDSEARHPARPVRFICSWTALVGRQIELRLRPACRSTLRHGSPLSRQLLNPLVRRPCLFSNFGFFIHIYSY
jgi:hypothetical protein